MLKIHGPRVLVLRLKLVAREVHVTILDRTHEVHVKRTRQLMSIFDVLQSLCMYPISLMWTTFLLQTFLREDR